MPELVNVLKAASPPVMSAFKALSYDYVADYSPNVDDSEKDLFRYRHASTETVTQKDLKKYGKYKKIVDFLSSPTFGRIVYLATSALPLILTGNIILGAIAIGVALAYTTYSLIKDTKKYRDLKKIKEEGAILEFLADQWVQDPHEINREFQKRSHQYYSPESTSETALATLASDSIPIAANVLSGNVFGIAISSTSALFNSIKVHRSLNAYEFKKNHLLTYNEILADKLGIRYEPGNSLDKLRRMYNFHVSKYKPINREKASPVPLMEKSSLSTDNTFIADMGVVINHGLSWSKYQKRFTPEINPYLDNYDGRIETMKDNLPNSNLKPQVNHGKWTNTYKKIFGEHQVGANQSKTEGEITR